MARDGLNILATVFDIARLKARHGHGDLRLPSRPSSRFHTQDNHTVDDVVENSDDFRLPKTRSLVTMLVASMLMQVRYNVHIVAPSLTALVGHILYRCLLVQRICETSRRNPHFLGSCHWNPGGLRRDRTHPNVEIRRR